MQVNRSCGLHVHVDAHDLSVDEIKEIAKVWDRARPVIQYLVPLSRRENGYCRPLTARSLAHLRERRDAQRVDRYRDVNVASLARHNTIEFRLHSGTIDPHKISARVTFVLYFVQAVKNGLAARTMPVPQNFNALGEIIGMAHGPAVVWRRYCYLERRYNFFLEQRRTGRAQEEAA